MLNYRGYPMDDMDGNGWDLYRNPSFDGSLETRLDGVKTRACS